MRLTTFIVSILCALRVLGLGAPVFSAQQFAPQEYAPPAASGLGAVYVLENAAGVQVSVNEADAKWYKFSTLGAAYAQEVSESNIVRTPTSSAIVLTTGDAGVMIEKGTDRRYYWIVDYAGHRMDLRAVTFAPEQSCDRAILIVEGNAKAINYYGITGRQYELPREILVEYTTLEYSTESETYNQIQARETLDHIGTQIAVPAPLCDTYFVIGNDRFERAWGIEDNVQSPIYHAVAVEAETTAVQTARDADNEQKDGGDGGLGGSAPCEITFRAAVTDAAIFHQWELSRDPEFTAPDNTFTEEEFTFVFTEQGTSYVRFVANNADGTCEFTGPVYIVFIGESKLEIPNAFSPGASEGVNDLWKVSYRSLTHYDCHIFNRWGTRLFSSTEPSEGWDGKYHGKVVPAGVYYYVIKAEGADGVKYNKKGDINIINYTAPMGQPTE